MIMNRRTTHFLSCAGALCLSACALTSRSEPMRVRYYTLDTNGPQRLEQPAAATGELKIGRIDASNHLGEEIAFRSGKHELEYFDDRRWTEKPQDFLRRALMRALFQERGVTRVYSGPALSLDVELVQFEEVLDTQPRVRMQAVATLRDERRSLFQETFAIERPIEGAGKDDNEQIAAAFSAALQDVVGKMADRVVTGLNTTANAGVKPADNAATVRATE